MFGLVCVRAMEFMSAYSHPFLEDEDEPVICVKCGRIGCECGPECECSPSFDKVLPPQKNER